MRCARLREFIELNYSNTFVGPVWSVSLMSHIWNSMKGLEADCFNRSHSAFKRMTYRTTPT